MSEETTNTATEAASSERAGYCQDCGKPLTRETVRVVGTGVFCEPCLATRIGVPPVGFGTGPAAPPPPNGQPSAPPPTQPGAQSVPPPSGQHGAAWSSAWYGSGAAAPGAGFTPATSTHLPNPTLAGLLGVIPGVGAMYNGQLVKGLLHLAIFAAFVILQNNVAGIFGIFVAGWVIYQIFDAYHTARARRDGTPLPNLFGINDIADRIGSGQGFGTHPSGHGTPGAPPAAGGSSSYSGGYAASSTAPPPSAESNGWDGQPAQTPPAPYPPTAPSAGYGSFNAPPANWAGYVHPANFAAPLPPPPMPGYAPYAVPSADPGVGSAPYQEMFSGAGNPPAGASPVSLPPMPRRFPVGALWLIAFGVLVLVGNLSSEWRISGTWMLTALFAGLAVWTLTRRLEWAGGYNAVMDGQFPRLAGMLRAPIMLLTLSVMFFLQASHLATFGQTWPVFPIAFGISLILERTVGAAAMAPLPPAGAYYGVATSSAPLPPTGEANPPASTSSDSKDVQR